MLESGFIFISEILTDESATIHLDLILQDRSEDVEIKAEEQDILIKQHLTPALD